MSPTPPPDTAAELIDALLAAGEPVDAGGFSVDLSAAAAKLDAFAYVDRRAYLIPLAEAAGGLDAERLQVDTHGEDLQIRIRGVELDDPPRILAAPWALVGGDRRTRRDRALARLGVGLHMALGCDGVERIAIQYSTTDETWVAEHRRDAPPRVRRLPPVAAWSNPADADRRPRELQILIDRPWIERVSARGASESELALLRDAVAHSAREVWIDGAKVSGQVRAWEHVVSRGGRGYRVQAGLDTRAEEPSTLELWVEGVCVERLPSEGVGSRAVVELDAPARDLAQLRVVRDAAAEEAIAAAERARRAALAKLSKRDLVWTGGRGEPRPEHWPVERVDRVLGRPVRSSGEQRAAAVEHQAAAVAKVAQQLAAAPRPVPTALKAWALGRAVLRAANEEWTVVGLAVGTVATIAPELARLLVWIEPFTELYVLSLLSLAMLLVRELPAGVRWGWRDMRVLATGALVLDNGEPLRRLEKRRRESGKTSRVKLADGPHQIDFEELTRVTDLDGRGRYRPTPRAIVAPLLALGLVGWVVGIVALASVRLATALLGG